VGVHQEQVGTQRSSANLKIGTFDIPNNAGLSLLCNPPSFVIIAQNPQSEIQNHPLLIVFYLNN